MGNSFFHGLALGANKRLSRGLQVQMAYNLSKAIDNGAGVGNNTENLPQGIRGFYYWDMYAKRALSAQDLRNSFVSNFSYELPGGDFGGFGNAILNGWKINGIISILDGSPLNIVDDSRASRDYIGDRSNQLVNLKPGGDNNPVLGTPSQGHAFYYDPTQFLPVTCQAGVYCYETIDDGVDSRGFPNFKPDKKGRRRPEPLPELGYLPGFIGNIGHSTLTGPGLFTFDFSVLKDINLTENTRIQFRAEFFNLFNRPNFGSPQDEPWQDRGAPDPEAGLIDDTFTSARQIQFGLKFIF